MICTKDISAELKAKDVNVTNNNTTTETTETNEEQGDGSTFCLGDNTVALPVRPVIVISKKILKSDTTTNSTDNSNTNVTANAVK